MLVAPGQHIEAVQLPASDCRAEFMVGMNANLTRYEIKLRFMRVGQYNLKYTGQLSEFFFYRFFGAMVIKINMMHFFFGSKHKPKNIFIFLFPVIGRNKIFDICRYDFALSVDASRKRQIIFNLIPNRWGQNCRFEVLSGCDDPVAERLGKLSVICGTRLEVPLIDFLFSQDIQAVLTHVAYRLVERYHTAQHLTVEPVNAFNGLYDLLNSLTSIIDYTYEADRPLLVGGRNLASRAQPCEQSRRQSYKNSKESLISIEPKLETIKGAVLSSFFENPFHVTIITHHIFDWCYGEHNQKRKQNKYEGGKAPIHDPVIDPRLRVDASAEMRHGVKFATDVALLHSGLL